MKIAIITPNLPHYRIDLYKTLDSRSDIEVTHYSSQVDDNLSVLDTQLLKRFSPLTNLKYGRLRWQVGAVRSALKNDADKIIIMGDVAFASNWVAAVISRLRGKELFFWTQGWSRPENGVKRILRIVFYRLANGILLYSPRGRQLAKINGFPIHRTFVIYNSISMTSGLESHATDGTAASTGELRIGVVARLRPAKSIDLMIEALSYLKDDGVKASAVIVGEGPEMATLKQLANSLDVPVEFVGAKYSDDELANVYQNLDITVVPAFAGLTVIQSLAHGVPVIVNDNVWNQGPETDAVLDGETGFFFKEGDAQSLSETIMECAHWMRSDPTGVAETCRNEVRTNWTPQVQAQRIVQALQTWPWEKQKASGR